MRCFLSGWGGSCAEVRRPRGRGDAENELQSYTTVWAVLDGGGGVGSKVGCLQRPEAHTPLLPGTSSLTAWSFQVSTLVSLPLSKTLQTAC